MTPRLTKADAAVIRARLDALLESGATLPEALKELLAVDDALELLTPPEKYIPSVPQCNTVMDIARKVSGDSLLPETDKLAQRPAPQDREQPGRHPPDALLHHAGYPAIPPDPGPGLAGGGGA